MDPFSSIEWPYWLMIGGAILIAMSILGLAFTRNKEVATNPDSEPQMPPLPGLIDSSKPQGKRMTGNDHPPPGRDGA
jgi:hypothetical protein